MNPGVQVARLNTACCAIDTFRIGQFTANLANEAAQALSKQKYRESVGQANWTFMCPFARLARLSPHSQVLNFGMMLWYEWTNFSAYSVKPCWRMMMARECSHCDAISSVHRIAREVERWATNS